MPDGRSFLRFLLIDVVCSERARQRQLVTLLHSESSILGPKAISSMISAFWKFSSRDQIPIMLK